MIASARSLLVAALLVPSMALSGCLSTSYVIPQREVRRVMELPAEQRAKKLRVVQRFVTNRDPPPAPPLNAPPRPPPGATGRQGPVPTPPMYYRHYYGAWGDPTWMPLRPFFVHRSRPINAPPATSGSVVPRADAGGVPTSAGGPSPAAFSGTKVDDAKAAAALLVVGAVAIGVGLAVTEGARYDGFVDVHPDHPVHLLGENGSYRLTSLSKLHLASPQATEDAVIVRHEGIGMWERGRAPLHRTGLTYSIESGSRSVPIGDNKLTGTVAFDMLFGVFPHHMIGLVGGLSFGFGEAGLGDVFAFAPRFELQVIPLTIGWLHFGGFGGMSAENVWVETADGATVKTRELDATAFSFGALMQVEITTRLAFTARWGLSKWSQSHDGELPGRITVGLSVY